MAGDLSKNFSRKEFECPCGCGTDTIDYALVNALQAMVYTFSLRYDKVSVVITSGNRCREYNEVIQKQYNPNYVPCTSKSQHIYSKAADFKVYYVMRGVKHQLLSEAVDKYLKESHRGTFGIGIYSNRNHLDVRDTKARWDTR